jgi:polar amino acid transport system substrate-binding protein
MKKFVTIFYVLAIFAVFFVGCSKKSDGLTIKEGILLIGMEIGYPPMQYIAEDGKTLKGFDVDMALAIAEKLGLEAEFIDTAWDGIFIGVNTGKYDCIISSVTILESRLVNFNFSKPYIQTTLCIVMLRNSRHSVSVPKDLAGLRVAYQEATTSEFFMADLAKEGLRFAPFEYDKVTYCFDELRLGRIDAVVTDLLVAYEYLSRSDIFQIVWQGGEEEFGICLKKGNDALTEAIDRALDELFEDGTMLRISKEHFSGMDLVSAVRR